MRKRFTKKQSYQQAMLLASVMNPTQHNIIQNAEINKHNRYCMRCNNGYGYKMNPIMRKDTKTLYYRCPNCNLTAPDGQRVNGVRTI